MNGRTTIWFGRCINSKNKLANKSLLTKIMGTPEVLWSDTPHQ